MVRRHTFPFRAHHRRTLQLVLGQALQVLALAFVQKAVAQERSRFPREERQIGSIPRRIFALCSCLHPNVLVRDPRLLRPSDEPHVRQRQRRSHDRAQHRAMHGDEAERPKLRENASWLEETGAERSFATAVPTTTTKVDERRAAEWATSSIRGKARERTLRTYESAGIDRCDAIRVPSHV